MQEKIYIRQIGSTQPNLCSKGIAALKIVIHFLEIQEHIEYCEYNDNLIEQLEQDFEHNEKEPIKFIQNITTVKKQTNSQSSESTEFVEKTTEGEEATAEAEQ